MNTLFIVGDFSIRVSCPFPDCESAYKYQKYFGNHIRDVHLIPNEAAQAQAKTVYQAAFEREVENQRKDNQLELRQRRSAQEIFHHENDPSEESPIFHILFFDLETTGLRDPHIVEIAVVDLASGREFQTYMKPNKQFEQSATRVNGLSHNDPRIKSAPSPPEAFSSLLHFLHGLKQNPQDRFILIAHNGENFDQPAILRNFFSTSLIVPEEWHFADSIPMLQAQKPNLPSYSLPKLKDAHLPNEAFPLHTALGDVKCLIRIFETFYGMHGDELYDELLTEAIDDMN